MKLHLKLTVLLLLSICLSASAQSNLPKFQYDELRIYDSLLQNEKVNGTYAKALSTFEKENTKTSAQEHYLENVKDKKLGREYFAILALPDHESKTSTKKISEPEDISAQAAKRDDVNIELDALSDAFRIAFWNEPRDFYKAFEISFKLEKRLAEVTEQQFANKRRAYYKLGEAYYIFQDFSKSIELLEKALSNSPRSFDDTANLEARKILGICYANLGQMELSDSYFISDLRSTDLVLGRPIYNAYAVSHLACNAMMQGKWDKAIALSNAVFETLKATKDYGHLAGMCYCRGNSYLNKKQYAKVSPMVDSLLYYSRLDKYNYIKRTKQGYSLKANYFTILGDAVSAQTYNDSLVMLYKQEAAGFSSQYITKALEDAKNREISESNENLKASRNKVILISTIAIFGLLAAAVIAYLYRRKQQAYKDLVRRTRQWASSDSLETVAYSDPSTLQDSSDTSQEPSDEDRELTARIHELMVNELLYKDKALTLDSVAEQMAVSRSTLSRAINRATGKNFKGFVNEYRIKEAVRIITSSKYQNTYIDELYEQVGFNSYQPFYRAFKQITGLTPSEFKSNETTR